MKLRYTLFLLLLVSTLVTFAQDDDKRIYWSSNYKLKWSDFKGKPEATASSTAISHISLEGYVYQDSLPNAVVSVVFLPETSFTLDTTSKLLLEHEQLHFDIAELQARRARKSIDSLQSEKVNDKAKYTTLIHRCLEIRSMQDHLFDSETNFGRSAIQQKKWKEKVMGELKRHEKYESVE